MPRKDELPLVSVIIPVYNGEEFVARAVDSALEQDYPNMEIIVVDDGSTDHTADVLTGYGDKIRYFYQENQGPDAARNHAVSKAQGEYLAFLDADDEWFRGRLRESLKPMIEDKSIGLTYCYTIARSPDGKEVLYGEEADRKALSKSLFFPPRKLSTPAVTCRRSLYEKAGGFDRPLLAFADHDLWIRIRELSRIKCIPEPLTVCHEREKSRSRGKDVEEVKRCYFQIIKDGMARRPELYRPYRRQIMADAYFLWGRQYYMKGMQMKSFLSFARSFIAYPSLRAFMEGIKSLLPHRVRLVIASVKQHFI